MLNVGLLTLVICKRVPPLRSFLVLTYCWSGHTSLFTLTQPYPGPMSQVPTSSHPPTFFAYHPFTRPIYKPLYWSTSCHFPAVCLPFLLHDAATRCCSILTAPGLHYTSAGLSTRYPTCWLPSDELLPTCTYPPPTCLHASCLLFSRRLISRPTLHLCRPLNPARIC